MKYNFEKAEKSTVKVHIELDSAEWAKAQVDAYNKNKNKFSVPGFRKGKVPMKVLENAYGKGIFFEDAINIAFPKYFEEVLEKEPSIEIVASPDLDVEDLSDDGIKLIAIVPVKPELKLGAYKGIKFEKIEYNVTDEDIENDIKRLQERNSRLVDVTDRACADGDSVVIDYSGSVDGVKFDGGTAKNQTLVLGSKSFIPGFEDQVVGMAIVNTDGDEIVIVTDKGYGKRTNVDAFRVQVRGGKGVKALNLTAKNGKMVSLLTVRGDEDLMIVTDKGMIIRTHLDQILTIGRDTQGVRLIKLKDDQKVSTIAILKKDEESEEEQVAE